MDLSKKIAFLESLVDHYETEFSHLNQLLVQCGFSEGIATLKMSAEELLKETSPDWEKIKPESL